MIVVDSDLIDLLQKAFVDFGHVGAGKRLRLGKGIGGTRDARQRDKQQ